MSSIDGQNEFDYCKCGNKLRGSSRKRTKKRSCHKCTNRDNMPNFEYTKICKEVFNTPTEPSDDELIFEDCQKAINEVEYGKVIKQSVGYVYTESAMASAIRDKLK